MSTKYQEKRHTYKVRQEQRSGENKFGFDYDESKINFRTEIPQLPTKPKIKPNEESHNKKVEQLQQKIDHLKEERRKKKEQYNRGSVNFNDEIDRLKSNIALGQKCIVVLQYDLSSVNSNLNEVEEKIGKKIRLLKNLQRQTNKASKKSYQQMSYQQLENQQYRISVRISTSNLNKKQQIELNSLLSKLGRLKVNAPRVEKSEDGFATIGQTQEAIDRLKVVRQKLKNQHQQIKQKIQAIQEDIEDFQQDIQTLEDQKNNPQILNLQQECKNLKQEISKLREQRDNLKREFEQRKKQYEHQQAEIEWIKWATDIQTKKNEQWEAQRQERRRQRLREKHKEKTGEIPSEQAIAQQAKQEKKRFNRYQTEIDNCSFLISYCQDLISKQGDKDGNKQIKTESKNLEQALKTGQWSKLKDVKLIKSKKIAEEEQEKPEKVKRRKNKKQQEEQISQPKTFNHQFMVLHAFDSVKVTPPSKNQEVEETVSQLNEKLKYFLEHPEGARDSHVRFDRGQRTERTQRPERRQKENKRYKESKTVVNTADFPSLN